ncbi:MAG: alanine racemase [Nitrospirota bacterium]|nr:alanine racemase [Nitrospirota bacterium]MDH5586011.1 alanine racemase [Nitrospirota bacterium]
MVAPTALASPSSRTPLTVCIHLDVLKTNFQNIRQFVPPTTKILPIIKADAYGHGSVPVAQTLESLPIFGFGVASVTEGIRLREHHIHAPIIIMGPLLKDHIPDIIHYQFTPVISHQDIFQELLATLPSDTQAFPIHLKIDTGLHRLGFEAKEALAVITSLSSTPKVKLQGLLTHFADADNPDPSLTNQQLHQFQACIQQIQEQGIQVPLFHMANSAGILFHPTSHLGMVRPGIMLYGYAPGQEHQSPPIDLQPVMQATTYIAHLRSLEPGEVVGYNALFRTRRLSQVAVLPVGYTHGFPRHLTGKGHVLIQGTPAPIIGKICMDMMMVDVTDIRNPTIGEEVVLLGRQGQKEITAQNFAEWLNTIPYEVLCGIGGKANRTYFPPE